MAAGRKKASKKKKTSAANTRKTGKANSLPGKLWHDWLKYVLSSLGPEYFLIVYLCQALCLRVSQVAQLQSSDFDWKKKEVWIKQFKRHEGFHKPILHSVYKQLARYKQQGIKGGSSNIFTWPSRGFLFPAKRSDSTWAHVAKDSICHAIARVRQQFVLQHKHKSPSLEDRSIRSHSGRRRCITTMAENSVPDSVGMAYAGIKSVRVYKGYVDVHCNKLRSQLKDFDRKSSFGKASKTK